MSIRSPFARAASVGVVLALAGCASPHAGDPAAVEPAAGRVADVPADVSSAESAPSPDRQPVATAQQPSRTRRVLSAAERAVLDDPTFKRRLVESYIAETEIEPGVDVEERELIGKAIEAISAEKLDEAVKILTAAATEEASASVDFMLATVHAQRDDLDAAIRASERAVQKYPKFRRAWRGLADMHYRRGDFDKARKPLTRVIELGGGDAVTYGILGVVHAKRGDDIAAESAFRRANLLAPDDLNWKRGLAESFFKQERFADAAALFSSLIREQPDNAELWIAQGRAYGAMNQPMKAAQNFEVVDGLGKSTSESLNGLGVIYANEGLYDLAVGAYVRALEVDAKASPDRAILAADYLGRNGALDSMRTLLDGLAKHRADGLDQKQQQTVLRLRQRLAAAQGEGAEQRAVLESLVELDPTDGQALIDLARYWADQQDTARAILHFERAANIDAFEAKAKLRHAELLVRDGKFAEALPLIRRAHTLDPRDAVRDFMKQVERAAQIR